MSAKAIYTAHCAEMHAVAVDVDADTTPEDLQGWLEKQRAWHRKHFPKCQYELALTKQC